MRKIIGTLIVVLVMCVVVWAKMYEGYLCDMCGKDATAMLGNPHATLSFWFGDEYHLCAGCATRVRRIMKQGANNEN